MFYNRHLISLLVALFVLTVFFVLLRPRSILHEVLVIKQPFRIGLKVFALIFQAFHFFDYRFRMRVVSSGQLIFLFGLVAHIHAVVYITQQKSGFGIEVHIFFFAFQPVEYSVVMFYRLFLVARKLQTLGYGELNILSIRTFGIFFKKILALVLHLLVI